MGYIDYCRPISSGVLGQTVQSLYNIPRENPLLSNADRYSFSEFQSISTSLFTELTILSVYQEL